MYVCVCVLKEVECQSLPFSLADKYLPATLAAKNGSVCTHGRRISQERMSSTESKPEYLVDEDETLYIKVGEGRICRACEKCRQARANCVCRADEETRYQERMKRQQEFLATLPRKMTKEEILANEYTSHDAKKLFQGEEAMQWIGAVVSQKKDGSWALAYRRLKAM